MFRWIDVETFVQLASLIDEDIKHFRLWKQFVHFPWLVIPLQQASSKLPVARNPCTCPQLRLMWAKQSISSSTQHKSMNQIFNLYILQPMPIFYSNSILPNQFPYITDISMVRSEIRLKAEWETEHTEKWTVINKSELFHIRKLQT